MAREFPPEYQCADLRIRPSLGTIANGSGASVRLGPVKMKVLETLLNRAGAIVSRDELFDVVWQNQTVSEDALTRSVSDIRSELRMLSGRDDWIETLPKRGYRWLGEARAVEARESEAKEPDVLATEPDSPVVSAISPPLVQRLTQLTLRGTSYLGALAVMAMALVWIVDRMSADDSVIVALLPATAPAELTEQAAAFDLALTEQLMQLDGVRVLSPSAIGSRPANPFPFFAYEFGARWLIETDLRAINGSTTIVLTVADARTGITEIQISDQLDENSAMLGTLLKFIAPE